MDKSPKIAHIDSRNENSTTAVLRLIGFNGSEIGVENMGYTPDGRRRNPQQKTVRPPTGLTPKQTEKWLQEQAMLFEMSCKKMNPDIDRSITLEKYTEIWLQTIAPDKLAKSTLVREKQDIERFKPYLGSYKLVDLRPEHFRSLYAKLRKHIVPYL